MRRISALAAAAFLVALHAEGAGAHRCPHHDSLPGEAAAGSSAASHAHDDDGGVHPCTCVGVCQGEAAGPIAPTSAAPSLEAPRPEPVAPTELREPGLPAADFLIPFPHGPPALA